MLDTRNDEMPMSEWLNLPEAARLAIAREHGYRKRPAAPPQVKATVTMPPVSSAPRMTPTPQPLTLAPQRPPTLEESIAAEWFGEDSTIRDRFDSFSDYVTFRLAAAEGMSWGEARAAGGRGISQADYDVARAFEEDRACGADPRLPLEARSERVFKANAEVRREFGSLDRYVAYRRGIDRQARRA
jgi:hypothetical protein